MRARLWPAVAVSFGALLFLLPLFAWLVSREDKAIQERTTTARRIYHRADDAISDIQESINKGLLLQARDSRNLDFAAAEREVSDLQRNTQHDCTILLDLLDPGEREQILALRQGLDKYLSVLKQSLRAQGERKLTSGPESQPEKVLDLAGRIDALNQASLAREEHEIEAQQSKLRRFAIAATITLLLMELAIAIFSTVYMAKLDRVSEAERKRAEKAEHELRRLSNQLVRVQEEERKTISRELHDEVGQLLTGLRMELGALSYKSQDEESQQRLESVKRLAEEALRSVRNLALLVRPSMLDDLGLGPALQWQAKEFSRRCGLPVSVDIEGKLDNLPEAHRLCLYRAIQEAMTNCGKHADASRVSVVLKHNEGRVVAIVQDDGRGFDALAQTAGLGLMGMTERVRGLQGYMSVASEPGYGTLITLELPVEADPVT